MTLIERLARAHAELEMALVDAQEQGYGWGDDLLSYIEIAARYTHKATNEARKMRTAQDEAVTTTIQEERHVY